jgi:hypothetical protein
MHEDYHDYLTDVIIKARGGVRFRVPHSEEDLSMMLLDTLFQYGLTPIKDIEFRADVKFDYGVLLRHLVDTFETNESRFYNRGKVHFNSGESFNLFPRLFARIMAADEKAISSILNMVAGREFFDLIGYDIQKGFSFERLRQQTMVDIDDGIELIFNLKEKMRSVDDPDAPIEDFSFSQFIVANSILLMQMMIEQGHPIADVFEVFEKRNSWLLTAFGMDESLAKEYGRFMACSSLFPYDPSEWPKNVKFADLLGCTDASLKSVSNYRSYFCWQHSPLQGVLGKLMTFNQMECEDRFNSSPLFCRYYQGLRAENLEDKHFMTLGMASLLNQYCAEDLVDYGVRAVEVLIKVLENNPSLSLFEEYIYDVMKTQLQPVRELVKICFTRYADCQNEDDLPYLIDWVHTSIGQELFDSIAREYIVGSNSPNVIKALLVNMTNVSDLAQTTGTSVKRLLIEHEMSL